MQHAVYVVHEAFVRSRLGLVAQPIAEYRVEWLGQLAGHGVVVVDVQALKEGEIELPPETVASFQVCRRAIASPRDSSLKVALGLSEVALYCHQSALSRLDFGRQAVLLALEEIERDGVGVVGVEQLLAFAFQLAQSPLLSRAFMLGFQS